MKNPENVLADFLTEEELTPESLCGLLMDLESGAELLEESLSHDDEYQGLKNGSDDNLKILEGKRRVMAKSRGFDENKKLREEIQTLRKSVTDARRLMDSNPSAAELKTIKKDISRIREALSIFDVTGIMPEWAGIVIAKNREEVMGITRERISDVLVRINKGETVERGDLAANPSVYEGVKSFLKRTIGISDRLSYEIAIYGGGDFFPHHLMEIALGRKLIKPVTETEISEAGDELYGELDPEPVIQQVGQLFFSQKINSGKKIIALTDDRLKNLLKKTRAHSIEFLVRILNKTYNGVTQANIKEFLADCLYPDSST